LLYNPELRRRSSSHNQGTLAARHFRESRKRPIGHHDDGFRMAAFSPDGATLVSSFLFFSATKKAG